MLRRLRELLGKLNSCLQDCYELRCAPTAGLSARCCRSPAVSIPAAPNTRNRPWHGMAHGAAVGLPHGGYAVADLGIRAVTTRCPEDGHATAHSVVHLRLFPADALGSLGQGAPAEAPAGCSDRAAGGACRG